MKDTPSTSQPDSSLTFEKPTFKLPFHPSKAALRQTTHNFNTHHDQHYSTFEDLAQALCVMSALEVLQVVLHNKKIYFPLSVELALLIQVSLLSTHTTMNHAFPLR